MGFRSGPVGEILFFFFYIVATRQFGAVRGSGEVAD